MPRFCASCGTQMADTAAVCPKCGKSSVSAAAPAAGGQTGGLADNIAGLLCYVTIIPPIIFLVIEPYNKNKFIRFHAFQALFFYVAWIILSIALGVVGAIPVLGWATLIIWPLLGLAGLVIWVLLLMKAYQGQMWHLPVVGDLAEKQANA